MGDRLRILVSLRSDAASKPGGDVSLMRVFADQLADRHLVDTVVGVPSLAELRASDVVVTANLDRPVEPAATLALADRAGATMIHYALHHPAQGVAAYLDQGVHGIRRQLARLAGGSPTRYEQLLWTLHAGRDLIADRRLPALASVPRCQRNLLAGARVVVSSEAEAAAIGHDIGAIDHYQVVAHPRDFPAGRRSPVAGRVVVPGRIESRKNQLLALDLAHRFPDLEFLFVGAPNTADGRYLNRFHAALGRTDNATHVEHLPKDEFYPLLLTAQVVLSASWFEVTSMVELYCADNGIPLAVSRHSYLDAPGPIHRFDPADVAQAAEALRAGLVPMPVTEPARTCSPVATAAGPTIVDVVDGLV